MLWNQQKKQICPKQRLKSLGLMLFTSSVRVIHTKGTQILCSWCGTKVKSPQRISIVKHIMQGRLWILPFVKIQMFKKNNWATRHFFITEVFRQRKTCNCQSFYYSWAPRSFKGGGRPIRLI